MNMKLIFFLVIIKSTRVMVFITEDLIRKRAEHNECEITTLEELSLHQCDIERIKYIDKWCRELKILYLQSNLIPKIENISRLKKLEYLNLALNNILHIENLEGCESLTKLDLTVNFVARATSVENLQPNKFLRELYLTGNPCSDYVGYRDYVIATLPQLEQLDGVEINRSERIKAMQCLPSLKCDILRQENSYIDKVEKEKSETKAKEANEGKPGFKNNWYTDTEGAHIENNDDTCANGEKSEDKKNDDFWHKPTKYTPETRLETHRYMEEQRKEKEAYKTSFPDLNPPKRVVRFFNDEGKPFNINHANMEFSLQEDDEQGVYVLDVACYKYLDTSLIDVDIQPTYVRVTIKGKVFQLVLNQEVSPDGSTAHRSQTTGHLVVTLPKLKHILEGRKDKKVVKKEVHPKEHEEKDLEVKNNDKNKCFKQTHEKLEIGEIGGTNKIDIFNIVKEENKVSQKSLSDILFSGKTKTIRGRNEKCLEAEKDFVDDEDVPPLD